MTFLLFLLKLEKVRNIRHMRTRQFRIFENGCTRIRLSVYYYLCYLYKYLFIEIESSILYSQLG